ncbi:hypothetical protein V5799_008182 [Amblyomma americanum]|uniref:Nlr family card domain protein n=1 Tax=Amblyomma americanum TaxID=6943 RepID=A0AAQ4FFG6_AMBAM
MHRPCSSGGPQECWMCFELPSWNIVLNPLGLNLSETEPGKLTLATFKPHHLESILDPESPYASCSLFFMTWLPRKHRCIHFLVVDRDVPSVTPPIQELLTETKFGAGTRCHLRHITWATPCENWQALGFFQTADSLDKLDVSFAADVSAVPAQVSHLLQQSAGCLNALKLCIPLKRHFASLYTTPEPCPPLSELDATAACTECVPTVVAKLLSSGLSALHKLTLFFPKNWCSHNDFIQAVRSHKQLREVHLVSEWSEAFAVACEALRGHASVRRLALAAPFAEREMPLPAASVAPLLYENVALVELKLRNFVVTRRDSEVIFWALEQNRTLRYLDILGIPVDFAVAEGMVSALRKNDSLKRLRLERIEGSAQERVAFASLLGSIGCTSRVEMLDWHCDDLVAVSTPLLAATSAVPKDVLIEINCIRAPGVSVLLGALAGPGGAPVRQLGLQLYRQWMDETRDAICSVLDSNASIQALEIIEDTCDEEFPGVYRSLLDMSDVLCRSSRLAQLSVLNAEQLDDAYAKWLGPILERNESIVEVALCQKSVKYFPEDTFETLAEAFLRNRFVVDVRIECVYQDSKQYGISRAMTRNRTLLNDAARFVLGTNESPRCARACELLATKHSLLKLLRRVTGKREAEARGVIRAALGRIGERFLVFAGVVKNSVSCGPAHVTQVDALNGDCWRAIGRYLKLSDVVGGP